MHLQVLRRQHLTRDTSASPPPPTTPTNPGVGWELTLDGLRQRPEVGATVDVPLDLARRLGSKRCVAVLGVLGVEVSMTLGSIVSVRVLLLVGAEDAGEALLEFLEDARHFRCHELVQTMCRACGSRTRRDEMYDVFINTSVDKTMWGQPSLLCEVRVRGG